MNADEIRSYQVPRGSAGIGFRGKKQGSVPVDHPVNLPRHGLLDPRPDGVIAAKVVRGDHSTGKMPREPPSVAVRERVLAVQRTA